MRGINITDPQILESTDKLQHYPHSSVVTHQKRAPPNVLPSLTERRKDHKILSPSLPGTIRSPIAPALSATAFSALSWNWKSRSIFSRPPVVLKDDPLQMGSAAAQEARKSVMMADVSRSGVLARKRASRAFVMHPKMTITELLEGTRWTLDKRD